MLVDKIKEIVDHKDLIYLLARKQLKVTFSQTILGFMWFFLTPLIMAFVYSMVFGNFAKISTGATPPILFYLSGVILWELFSGTFILCSNTLNENVVILSKVYFPRIIPPLVILVTNLVKFGIRFLVFLLFYLYYYYQGLVEPSIYIFGFPLIAFIVSLLGFACGIWTAAYAVKYKDILPFVNFSMSILMYLTPVLYPISMVPGQYRIIGMLNPLISLFEGFRVGWFGVIDYNYFTIVYSIILTAIIVYWAIRVYEKSSKSFIDTI